jgi:nucleoside-diphosphate-sugar epimerase
MMGARVLLAGATGAVGQRLIPLLLQGGATVFGTTRSPARADALRSQGVEPVVVDVFDAPALTRATVAAGPEVVIHQLTDLALIHDPSRREEALTRNARLRTTGTANLAAAAREAGARRMIAQSIAWVYAPGPEPHAEDDPLDVGATDAAAITVQGVVALEHAVLTESALEGLVLRYGWLYGPGTGTEAAAGTPPLHVDAAARAAALAIDRGAPGVYNIAEPSPSVSVEKARRELGWDPGFRSPADSPSR